MSKKRKYFVDVPKACQMFQIGYSLHAKVMNEYQIRLSDEEHTNVFYDWYHTTGSLVRNKNGFCKGMTYGQYGYGSGDPEEVGKFINQNLMGLDNE